MDSDSYEFKIYEKAKNVLREDIENSEGLMGVIDQGINIQVVDKIFQPEYVSYGEIVQCDIGMGMLNYRKCYIEIPVKSDVKSDYTISVVAYRYIPPEGSDVPPHSHIFRQSEWTPEDLQDFQDAIYNEDSSLDWDSYGSGGDSW